MAGRVTRHRNAPAPSGSPTWGQDRGKRAVDALRRRIEPRDRMNGGIGSVEIEWGPSGGSPTGYKKWGPRATYPRRRVRSGDPNASDSGSRVKNPGLNPTPILDLKPRKFGRYESIGQMISKSTSEKRVRRFEDGSSEIYRAPKRPKQRPNKSGGAGNPSGSGMGQGNRGPSKIKWTPDNSAKLKDALNKLKKKSKGGGGGGSGWMK